MPSGVRMKVVEARFCENDPRFKKRKPRGLKREGLLYERRAGDALLETKPQTLWRGPWFEYRLGGEEKDRICQPDMLLLKNNRLYVVEAKRTALIEAYDKLEDLYCPVVELAFKGLYTTSGVQIFKFLTKATLTHKPVVSIHDIYTRQETTFGIHFLA